jgi:hypothetical protein
MTRRKLAWPLSLGLLVGGWAAAHVLAYRLVVPSGEERRHLLEAAGHGYLDPAPLVSLSLTLVVLGLGGCVLSGRDVTPAPWLFALLPPLAFVVQEHLERLLHDGNFPYAAVLEPTFGVGLLLQLPFALLALLFARALLVLSGALVRRMRRAKVDRLRRPCAVRRAVADPTLARIGLLALGHGQRAPPAFLLR